MGGVITGLMLGAWMLGRWQSVPGAATGAKEAAPAEAALRRPAEQALAMADAEAAARHCQAVARAERRALLENASALSKLHEDVSAYRHAQQVLSEVKSREMRVGWLRSGDAEPCRYLGVSGQPTCPTPAAATMRHVCAICSTPLQSGEAVAAQPVAESAALTRV